MAPAIEIAERGYAVPRDRAAHKWAARRCRTSMIAAGLRRGLPAAGPRARTWARCSVFAAAARHAAPDRRRPRADAFYRRRDRRGDRRLQRGMRRRDRRRPTCATIAPEWVKPISRCPIAATTLHEIPPNGQGIAALIALGILDQFDVGVAAGGLARTSQHLQIEAMKLAFADTLPLRGRPAHDGSHARADAGPGLPRKRARS